LDPPGKSKRFSWKMLDTQDLMKWAKHASQLYTQSMQSIHPIVAHVKPYAQQVLGTMNEPMKLVATGLLFILTLFFFYRTARSAFGMVVSALMTIIQIGIFVLLLALVFLHSDGLIEKVKLVAGKFTS